MKKNRNYIATPPGVTIKEQLTDRGMTQKEFAVRMDMSEKHTSKLINGDVQLTIEVARKLEMVLGVPTQFWCNLEAIYREKLLKIQEESSMDDDIAIAQNIPYDFMTQNGWIDNAKGWSDRVVHLRKYFELVQLIKLKDSLIPAIACRKLSGAEASDLVIITWAQKAKLEARHINTKPINIEALANDISCISNIMSDTIPHTIPPLKSWLSNYGIAFVVLPKFEDSILHGATFLSGNKIVLGLTEEQQSEKFYYNLFHELAHILYHHLGKPDGTTEDDEKQADEYAKNMLQKFILLH